MTKRVAIFVSGGGSNMRALVQSMGDNHPARPCVIISNTPTAGGITWAREQGLPTEIVEHKPFGDDRVAFEDAINAALRPYGPDIICLAGFMRVLTPHFVKIWAGHMLNIHPSLLPKYRGLHTHQRALDAQETEHGCTVHEVTAKLDDGPILGQACVPVLPSDTETTLAARVLAQEHVLYPAVLRRYAAGDRTCLRLPTDADA